MQRSGSLADGAPDRVGRVGVEADQRAQYTGYWISNFIWRLALNRLFAAWHSARTSSATHTIIIIIIVHLHRHHHHRSPSSPSSSSFTFITIIIVVHLPRPNPRARRPPLPFQCLFSAWLLALAVLDNQCCCFLAGLRQPQSSQKVDTTLWTVLTELFCLTELPWSRGLPAEVVVHRPVSRSKR